MNMKAIVDTMLGIGVGLLATLLFVWGVASFFYRGYSNPDPDPETEEPEVTGHA